MFSYSVLVSRHETLKKFMIYIFNVFIFEQRVHFQHCFTVSHVTKSSISSTCNLLLTHLNFISILYFSTVSLFWRTLLCIRLFGKQEIRRIAYFYFYHSFGHSGKCGLKLYQSYEKLFLNLWPIYQMKQTSWR